MRIVPIILVFIFFSCGKPDLTGFEKMEGTWKAEMNGGAFVESWEVDGDQLKGQGFFIIGKDTTFGEKLTVKMINDTLTYIADVPKQQPVNFPLFSKKNTTWIFRNPNHDFPRTITYKLTDDDHLHVELFGFENIGYEGLQVTEPTKEEFNFVRTSND